MDFGVWVSLPVVMQMHSVWTPHYYLELQYKRGKCHKIGTLQLVNKTRAIIGR